MENIKHTLAKSHIDFLSRCVNEIELFRRNRPFDSQIKRIATITDITELSALFILSEIARMMLTCIYHMLSEEMDFHPDDYEAVIHPPMQKSIVLNLDNTLQFLREQGADPEALKLIQQQCATQSA